MADGEEKVMIKTCPKCKRLYNPKKPCKGCKNKKLREQSHGARDVEIVSDNDLFEIDAPKPKKPVHKKIKTVKPVKQTRVEHETIKMSKKKYHELLDKLKHVSFVEEDEIVE
jgi:RNA polymerase subunit RPABC4/transcription elongation factor Spt4